MKVAEVDLEVDAEVVEEKEEKEEKEKEKEKKENNSDKISQPSSGRWGTSLGLFPLALALEVRHSILAF